MGGPHGEGLDHKLLLRADGTSVYMTQDIGTAKLRFADYPIDKMIYVVGNEQNYHLQVLSILSGDKLWASNGVKGWCTSLRYGGTSRGQDEEPRRYCG